MHLTPVRDTGVQDPRPEVTMTTMERPRATFLPEPEPAEVRYTLISVDDHVIEPPDLFDGRMPKALADVTPRVVELDDGAQGWLVLGEVQPSPGLNAVAGRPPAEWKYDPTRFDEMRPGCYQIEHRIRDMDLNGLYASICFPSYLAGFGGANFNRFPNHELGLASCGRGTTGISRRGPAHIPTESSRFRSRGSTIQSSLPMRSGATRPAARRRCRSRRCRTSSLGSPG
jgi:hypothetical protein